MNSDEKFSLEKHNGPYERWPLKSRLLRNGTPLTLQLPGYNLLFQRKLSNGDWLFVTDYDCPHEEYTTFLLVSAAYRILAQAGAPASLFKDLERTDDQNWIATCHDSAQFHIHIRAWGIPYLYPRLRLTRIA